METIELSIIIVNWNSKDYLKACIDSILQQSFKVTYEIIVIDSASFDGCDQMLKGYGSLVKFIQSKENIGFPEANNQAFPYALGTYLLFLNPDTFIEDHSIEILLDALKNEPLAGIVGPKLLNTDRSLQTSCVQSFPSIFNVMVDTNFLRSHFPNASIWGMTALFNASVKPKEVDVIAGACLMIKRSVFEEIGGFPKDYFMYSEDVDLCFQSRLKGYKNYLVPSAVIIHHGGGSSGKRAVNTFAAVMMLESQWRYFKKNYSLSYAGRFRTMIFLLSMVRICLLMVALPYYWFSGRDLLIKHPLEKWMARLKWTISFDSGKKMPGGV